MKCPYCGKEFTSEKIFDIHTRKCVAMKQDDQPLEKEKGKEMNKTTQRKQRQKRDAK